MNMKCRLAVLEKGYVTEPTILTMSDGTTVNLAGRGDYLVRLLGAVFSDCTPEQQTQLDLVRRCTACTEQGNGQLVELIRALLLSPVTEPK